jgi:hypothetical protein
MRSEAIPSDIGVAILDVVIEHAASGHSDWTAPDRRRGSRATVRPRSVLVPFSMTSSPTCANERSISRCSDLKVDVAPPEGAQLPTATTCYEGERHCRRHDGVRLFGYPNEPSHHLRCRRDELSCGALDRLARLCRRIGVQPSPLDAFCQGRTDHGRVPAYRGVLESFFGPIRGEGIPIDEPPAMRAVAAVC